MVCVLFLVWMQNKAAGGPWEEEQVRMTAVGRTTTLPSQLPGGGGGQYTCGGRSRSSSLCTSQMQGGEAALDYEGLRVEDALNWMMGVAAAADSDNSGCGGGRSTKTSLLLG